MLTDALLNIKATRERMTQVMFENFNLHAVHIANPFVRYVSRRTTGFVMDFVYDVSHTTLIFDG